MPSFWKIFGLLHILLVLITVWPEIESCLPRRRPPPPIKRAPILPVTKTTSFWNTPFTGAHFGKYIVYVIKVTAAGRVTCDVRANGETAPFHKMCLDGENWYRVPGGAFRTKTIVFPWATLVTKPGIRCTATFPKGTVVEWRWWSLDGPFLPKCPKGKPGTPGPNSTPGTPGTSSSSPRRPNTTTPSDVTTPLIGLTTIPTTRSTPEPKGERFPVISSTAPTSTTLKGDILLPSRPVSGTMKGDVSRSTMPVSATAKGEMTSQRRSHNTNEKGDLLAPTMPSSISLKGDIGTLSTTTLIVATTLKGDISPPPFPGRKRL